MKNFCCVLTLFIFYIFFINIVNAKDANYEILVKRLSDDGFDSSFIENLYNNNEAVFMPNLIVINVKKDEERIDYKQYSSDSMIIKSKDYFIEYKKFLKEIQKEFGIKPEFIVTILLVETRLGTYLGKHKVINVLSSLSVSNKKDAIDDIYKKYIEDKFLNENQKLSIDEVAIRVKKRSDWAYKELKIFLKYVLEQNLNPYEINGSLSGAFGFAQFIPSAVIYYGKDGDKDGNIDMFNHYDAIASIANYLKGNGWIEEDIPENKIKSVIETYNHSIYYVNGVYESAIKLKQKLDN
ncbi:MAG: lytic murein transglycosylase [Candidatus Firestonebacteria bacterium]|nr:lytic murein transglycosylase [Candidatus Firestonebacteria bacterium]